MSNHPQSSQRLDSWKEIASYLDRSVRTVRRWEEKEGLPVHRHQHDKGSTVFAHRDELEAWLEERKAEPATAAPPVAAETKTASAPNEPQAAPSRRHWAPVLAFAATALLVAAGLAWWVRLWEAGPAGFATAGNADSKHWVLITQFENRTDNELFEGLVEYALEREVSNSKRLRVVPKERVENMLSLMRKPTTEPVSGQLGREICQRDTGITGLILGRVETLGSDYLMSVDLVNPSHGETLVNLSRQFKEGQQLLPTLHQLAREVREALNKTLPTVAASERTAPEPVTTASFEALELFSRASRLIEEDAPAPAAVLLRQAIEIDPSFASAQMQLSWLEREIENDAAASLARAEVATSMLEGLSAAEKFYIRGSYAHLQGDYPEADAAYQALLSIDPSHYWGNTRAFEACRELRADENCVPYRVRLANRRPADFRANSDAAWAIAVLSTDLEKAERYVERARMAAPSKRSQAHVRGVVMTELFPVYKSWIEADYEAAAEARAAIEADFRSWSLPVQDSLARELGALDLAFGKLESATHWFDKISDPVLRHEMQALVFFAKGEMESLGAHLKGQDRYEQPMTAVLLAMTGAPERAETMMARLAEQGISEAHGQVAEGQLAMMQGRLDEAIELFGAGADRMTAPAQAMYFAALDMKATALRKSGRLEEAIKALEMTTRLRTQSAFAGTGLFWTKCQFHLVQLYRSSEQMKAAKALEVELRQKLANADCDFPIHAELLTRRKPAEEPASSEAADAA